MRRLQGQIRHYPWGSSRAIPEYFGYPGAEQPVAEVWLGAHPDDSACLVHEPDSPLFDRSELGALDKAVHKRGVRRAVHKFLATREVHELASHSTPLARERLLDVIAADPVGELGEAVASRYGGELPYLLKIIAPNEPLSLQVHPSRAQAREGYAREDAAGIPRESAQRNYKDRNHKPELTYALAPFEALAGFRAPRKICEVLRGLNVPVIRIVDQIVRGQGVCEAFRYLVDKETRPKPSEVHAVVEACAARDPEESPSRRADSFLLRIAEKYPGDPGVIASLLLNPVSLRPGEALFIPAGTIHAYLSGLAVEIMASSDNVLRAGLTPKHMDVSELLNIITPVAAPPTRIAAERISASTSTFYVPVDDFELSIIKVRDTESWERLRAKEGPRTLVCIDGACYVRSEKEDLRLHAGQALFVSDTDGSISVRGFGRLILASVP